MAKPHTMKVEEVREYADEMDSLVVDEDGEIHVKLESLNVGSGTSDEDELTS